MKKSSIFAAVASALLISSPAFALDVPSQDAYLDITPCETNCLYAGVIDAASGATLDSFEIDTSPLGFDNSAISAELDPATSTAYFLTYGGYIYSADIAIDGDDVELLSTVIGLPTLDGLGVGLALDDATGALYLLYADPDAFSFYVVSIDRETGKFGTPLAMPAALWSDGAYDFTIAGGILYVLTDLGHVSKFNLNDGTEAGSFDYPEIDWLDPFAIDISEGGVLRVVSHNSVDGDDFFISYDLGTSTWSEPIDSGSGFDGIAWYGVGTDPELAETGFESNGLIAGSAALVAAGGAIALRRRARR